MSQIAESKKTFKSATLQSKLDDVDFFVALKFDPEIDSLIGLFRPLDTSKDIGRMKYNIGLWKMKDGMLSGSPTTFALPKEHYPGKELELVKVEGKTRLLLITTTDEHTENRLTHIIEANFHIGSEDIISEIDTSKFVNADNDLKKLRVWKNLLFVTVEHFSSFEQTMHVYKDLKYQSKLTFPSHKDYGRILLNFCVSDKYFITSHGEYDPPVETSIRIYTWSPEKLEFGDMIYGPLTGYRIHQFHLLNSHYLITNTAKDEKDWSSKHQIAVHNIEDKTCSKFTFREGQPALYAMNVLKTGDKVLAVLVGGEIIELQ